MHQKNVLDYLWIHLLSEEDVYLLECSLN